MTTDTLGDAECNRVAKDAAFVGPTKAADPEGGVIVMLHTYRELKRWEL